MKENYQKTFLSYIKALKAIARCLREQLVSKGHISTDYVDSLVFKYRNNTSFNTTRRHVNVLSIICMKMTLILNHLNLKVESKQKLLHKPIENVKELLETIKEV